MFPYGLERIRKKIEEQNKKENKRDRGGGGDTNKNKITKRTKGRKQKELCSTNFLNR